MKFKTFLILLACGGAIILSAYLGMRYLDLPKKAYKIIAAGVSLFVLSFAFLIKQRL